MAPFLATLDWPVSAELLAISPLRCRSKRCAGRELAEGERVVCVHDLGSEEGHHAWLCGACVAILEQQGRLAHAPPPDPAWRPPDLRLKHRDPPW